METYYYKDSKVLIPRHDTFPDMFYRQETCTYAIRMCGFRK